MNREDIIRMAREAKGHAYTNRHLPGEPAFAFSIDRLEHFFQAAYAAGAAAEREACAKACDLEVARLHAIDEPRPALAVGNCAIAIRARGNFPSKGEYMNNDIIIRLAQEAGLPTTVGWLDRIMRFAAAVEDASKAYWAYQAAKIVRARGQA